MNASSLNNSPDPHSVVERLEPCPFCGIAPRMKAVRDFFFISCENDECPVGCETSGQTCDETAVAWNTRPAATIIISELQAEAKLSEDRIQRLQAAVAFWTPGVSELVETETNGYAGDSACLLYGFNGEVPSNSWGDKILARALAAESSLSRIQSETVEACAKIAEEHTWTLPLYAPEENINVAVGEAANIVISQVASAIRSSLTNVGEAKTAESEHSPSTREG